jgi:protein-S-isoprenylcysteine O-methyltransferase Ste14
LNSCDVPTIVGRLWIGMIEASSNRMNTEAESPLLIPWRGLVRVHRELEETRWGRVILSNVWPAYLFALPLGAKLMALPGMLAVVPTGAHQDFIHYQARVVQELVTMAFLALVVVLLIVRAPVRGRHANWRGGAVALVGTFLLNVVGVVPVASSASTEALVASTLLIVAGTLFAIWSLAFLGRSFGVLPEARALVTGGPYRWVRHPVYLGELVSGFGIAIAKPHAAVVAVYVLFVLFQYWRTIFEERALAEAFPSQYPPYRLRTGRLVPWRR